MAETTRFDTSSEELPVTPVQLQSMRVESMRIVREGEPSRSPRQSGDHASLAVRGGLRAACFGLALVIAALRVAGAADPELANAAPKWWKGNLHTHTLWSDGDDFPEMVAAWYRDHDYHFLALSDHNIFASGKRWIAEETVLKRGGDQVIETYLERFGPTWVERRTRDETAEIRLKPFDEFRCLVEERGRFLMIPGEEISDRVAGKPLHINASNIEEAIQPVGGETMAEAIQANLRAVQDQAERAGREILAHLNHPNFGWGVTAADLAQATLERHVEVFNGHPGVNQRGDKNHPSVDTLWDIANTIRLDDLRAAPLFGVATDDCHNYHAAGKEGKFSRPGRGWVMVQATHLTPEKVIEALREGEFYASTGITLTRCEYDPESQMLSLTIEPDDDATFTTRFIASFPKGDAEAPRVGVEVGRVEGLAAEYRLTGDELYVRAVVTSSQPPQDPVWPAQRAEAWTQPVGWRHRLAGAVSAE